VLCQAGSCHLWICPYLALAQDVPGLPYTFSVLALDPAIYPRSSNSCSWRMVFGNQDFDVKYAHSYWDTIASSPSQELEYESVCVCVCVCVCV
jgi:hypothetical protein